jgi:hypothetical protein
MASKRTVKKFVDRVEFCVQKESDLYEKNGVMKRLVIQYPNSKGTPLLGRIGEWLLRGSGAHITTQYIDKYK